MENVFIDRLNLYRGKPFEVCNGIIIHIPTLDEICKYGEIKYYSMIHMLCSVGIDLCWQLEDVGIPFDEISDYKLFCEILRKQYTMEDTKILFGEKLDFSKMSVYTNHKNERC